MAGHIPGSVNLPIGDLLTKAGTFRPATELAAAFAGVGVHQGEPSTRAQVAASCGSGITACQLILAAELIIVLGGYTFAPSLAGTVAQPTPDVLTRPNTAALGDILYTDYVFYFQVAGLVLLVAMIGAIVLTLRHKPNVRRQSIPAQVARTPATAVELKKVETGRGIEA